MEPKDVVIFDRSIRIALRQQTKDYYAEHAKAIVKESRKIARATGDKRLAKGIGWRMVRDKEWGYVAEVYVGARGGFWAWVAEFGSKHRAPTAPLRRGVINAGYKFEDIYNKR